MPDAGYKIRNAKEIHFITFAVVEWVDVFTRVCPRIAFKYLKKT